FGPVNHPAPRYDRTAPRSFDSLPPSNENKNWFWSKSITPLPVRTEQRRGASTPCLRALKYIMKTPPQEDGVL
ncbi:hypothetical protein L6307_05305, partial [Candidatus Parcubacteria bacterium]|nr:hypothetical protein [Candidatus Parcubacteria bacterium]